LKAAKLKGPEYGHPTKTFGSLYAALAIVLLLSFRQSCENFASVFGLLGLAVKRVGRSPAPRTLGDLEALGLAAFHNMGKMGKLDRPTTAAFQNARAAVSSVKILSVRS